MKTIFFNVPLLGLIIFFSACGHHKADEKSDSVAFAKMENETNLPDIMFHNEASFTVNCAELHLMQVRIATLCETHAELDTVVKFGRILVKNQALLHQQLESWALANNVVVPKILSQEHQEKVNILLQQKERNFENKFTELVIQHQQELLNNYRRLAQNGSDTLLKGWARDKIYTIETDLQTSHWIRAVLRKAPLKGKS